MEALNGFNPASIAMFSPTNMGLAGINKYLQGIGTGATGALGSSAGSVANVSIPGIGGVPGVNGMPWQATPLGFNLGTAGAVVGGLQTIGNLWGAWEANKLAKKQFAFQKDITETNLANQIMSYNTALNDRIRSRAYTEQGQAGGLTQAQAEQYIQDNQLSRDSSKRIPGG